MSEPSELRGHVLKIELGEFTRYHLTCNLDDEASCHQVCETHMEGGCAETHLDPDLDQAPCVSVVYRGGCVIAEWVNDGGIEAVDFDHTIELPVEYQWNASHDYPTLIPGVPEPPNDAKKFPVRIAVDVSKIGAGVSVSQASIGSVSILARGLIYETHPIGGGES